MKSHNINSYEYRAAAAACRHNPYAAAAEYRAAAIATERAAENERRAAYASIYADAIAAAERRAALGL